MESIVFRSITPLYKFSIGQNEFLLSGKINKAEYLVSLKRYPHESGLIGFSEEVRSLLPDAGKDQIETEILADPFFYHNFDGYILLTETRYPPSPELEVSSNTLESIYITACMLNALEIFSTKGVFYKSTYEYRIPAFGFGRSNSTINRHPFGFLDGISMLPEASFSDCRKGFENLLRKGVQEHWNESATLDQIIQLAIQYHNVTFSLNRIDHAFLILMIAFEALFKKAEEDNITQAAGRIAKLLSAVKADAKKIKDDFLQSENSFDKIRNKIAHGNPSLDGKIVKLKYPVLYEYVTRAIARLLTIQHDGMIFTNKYYDEISQFTKDRFDTLSNE